tara:strand:+ start:20906 stop:21841 length:936 start_codon:yes stop_codon:yes gene_type:complete
MFKQFLKKLPIINLWHKNVRLNYDLSFSEQQLNNAIEKVAETHLRYLHLLKMQGDNVFESNNIIISLTSYNLRVELVHHTILSLLCQTVRPQKLILWLSETEFSLETLPDSLIELQQFGLEIAFCRDIRSYKKLIPTLKKYPDSTIITFDDDVIYPVDHVEKMVSTAANYPNMVICHLAHSITFSPIKRTNAGKEIISYNKWPKGVEHSLPCDTLFPVGVGGVLYPAKCLDNDVLNEEKFTTLCPYADDIWFKLMALKKGTLTKLVDQPKPFKDYLHLPNTQKLSLWKINIEKNDKQLAAVLAAYPEIKFD